MNIKNKALAVLLSASGLFGACANKQPVNQVKYLADDIRLAELVKDSFSTQFTDAEKVIKFNQLLNEYKDSASQALNYIIVDKKNCRASIYSPKGDTLKTFEVILGKTKGDKRAGGYWNKENNPRCYTTPGEYIINYIGSGTAPSNKRLYKQNIFWLKGDHTEAASIGKQATAIHQIPDSRVKKTRLNALGNKTLQDNRQSYGCVELKDSDCDTMKQYIKEGSRVYILTEEKGNSLKLEKQNTNTYKFFQRKYR